MNKLLRVGYFLVLAGSMLAFASAMAQASSISWYTTPVLGHAYTGLAACPASSNAPTYTWDSCATVTTDTGTIVVPAVSDPNSGSYGVGLPSQPIFTLDTGAGTTLEGTAYAASAVDKGQSGGSFDITFSWNYLGPSGAWNYTYDEGVDSNSGIVVNCCNGWIFNDYLTGTPDGGLWTYTETWTNTLNSADFITASTPFCVDGQGVTCTSATSTPEPCTLALLGFGLIGLGFVRRKRA